MSVGNHQEQSSSNTGANSSNVSPNRPYPIISNGDVLEDGEIVEGPFSSNASRPLSRRKNGPQLHLFNQVRASTPSLPAVAEPRIVSLAPTVEPMTKEDLDRAKSLVLDLLGWGVTPEYLVECGLSPGAVYQIFTDLRLRLPSNLETLSPSSLHHGVQ